MRTNHRLDTLRLLSALSIVALAACGSKTGLRVPDVATSDAVDVTDARDVCDPALPACHAVTVACGGGVTTRAGMTVTIEAMGHTVPPSTIVNVMWTVTASPQGSSYTFSDVHASPTTFTADSAGAYTVRFTATDSTGLMASCEIPVSVGATYRGTEFWAVSTSNSLLLGGDVFHFAVAVGNTNPDPVTATVTGGSLMAPLTFTVPPNTSVVQTLPWVLNLSHNRTTIDHPTASCCEESCCMPIGTEMCTVVVGEQTTSTLVPGGAYRITTSAPVSMYQFNALEFSSGALCAAGSNSYTNDASLLLPTPALTGNYLVLAHNGMGFGTPSGGSFVAIAGTSEMPTTVRVTLATDILDGVGVAAADAGSTQEYTLNRGDVVQLVSRTPMTSPTTGFLPEDMTGTVIQASAPVAVWAGVDCTNMSFPDGTVPACDHIEQMMFPTETWGNDVVVSQLRDRAVNEKYMVRILSRENGNAITFVPPVHAPVRLDRGRFLEFESAVDFEVTGTRPILVGQYMEGQGTTPRATVGDPAFVLEVPTPQFRREYSFIVPETYTFSFLNVVLRNGATFMIDGHVPGTGTAVVIPGTTWAVWRGGIAPGSHRLSSSDTAGFAVKVLGVASYTSYMYPAGLDLTVVP